MPPIKLAIADDQTLFLKGMRLLLKTFKEVELIIEAINGQELLDAIQKEVPDIILMDLRMPVMDGLVATEKVKELYPEVNVILLTMYDDMALINYMMKIGASGYLVKNEEPKELRKAIIEVAQKGFYFNDYVSRALLQGIQKKYKKPQVWEGSEHLQISPRELEVLDLICKGYTSAEVAERLFISIRTVNNHRKNIMDKTQTRNTAGLIIFAIRNRLVDVDLLLNGQYPF